MRLANPTFERPPGHSTSFEIVGLWLVWTSWYGFNVGSIASITGTHTDVQMLEAVIASIVAATTLAASLGSLMNLIFCKVLTSKWDASSITKGAVAGLAAITPCAGFIDVWWAIPIGIIAPLLLIAISKLLERIRIDDPVDSFASHFCPAAFGVFANAFISKREHIAFVQNVPLADVHKWGIFYGGHASILGYQILGLAVGSVWMIFWALVMIVPLHSSGIFRVSHETQLAGLDNTKHRGSAWPHFKAI